MPIPFHGRWLLEISGSPGTRAQVIISGSDASDGTYDGNIDLTIGEVSGDEWFIGMNYLDAPGPPPRWTSQSMERIATFTAAQGLLAYLTGDVSQTVVICKNLDPNLQPFVNPYDFTYDNEVDHSTSAPA